MRERATLKLDAGDAVRVEVDREDLDHDEIVVHRADNGARSTPVGLLEVVDAHLADLRHTQPARPIGTSPQIGFVQY